MESVVTAIPEIEVNPKVVAAAKFVVAVLAVGIGLNVTKNLKLRNGSVIKLDRLLMIVGIYLLSPSD
jgi:hypothetical protein